MSDPEQDNEVTSTTEDDTPYYTPEDYSDNEVVDDESVSGEEENGEEENEEEVEEEEEEEPVDSTTRPCKICGEEFTHDLLDYEDICYSCAME